MVIFMYIAVCDDNVADRKQLERLLGRESEKRKGNTGVFYVNSFGHASKLLAAPMQYDLFFIDVCQDAQDGLAIALELLRLGVTAPIVLCSSKIDYQAKMQETNTIVPSILHLTKAIKTTELTALLDSVIASRANIVPAIELRGEQETRYVHAEEILYAVNVPRGIRVYLADESSLMIVTTLPNLFQEIAGYSYFVLLSPKILVHVSYITRLSFLKATIKNGDTYFVSPSFYLFVKKVYRNYLSSIKQ